MAQANAPKSSYAIKYETDFMNGLAGIKTKDATPAAHAYFQLQSARSAEFDKRISALFRKCSTEEEVVNSINHALISNLIDSDFARSIFPVTADAYLARKMVKRDKQAAFAPVTEAELRKLEQHMASLPPLKGKSHKYPRFASFRIDRKGVLVGFGSGCMDVPPYPVKDEEEEEIPEEIETESQAEVVALTGEEAAEQEEVGDLPESEKEHEEDEIESVAAVEEHIPEEQDGAGSEAAESEVEGDAASEEEHEEDEIESVAAAEEHIPEEQDGAGSEAAESEVEGDAASEEETEESRRGPMPWPDKDRDLDDEPIGSKPWDVFISKNPPPMPKILAKPRVRVERKEGDPWTDVNGRDWVKYPYGTYRFEIFV